MRLNLDAGELPDESPELWAHFDILNIACGGHAGDAASMTRVIEFCIAHDVSIGAHPSYPDREHFGRRTLAIERDELRASLSDQLAQLDAIAKARGGRIDYVKPHGALYHDASRDPELAQVVIDAVRSLGAHTKLIGPRGFLHAAAIVARIEYLVEGFADRRLRPDGSLVPRTERDALITSPQLAARQARSLQEVDTICVHADTPNALEIARSVRSALRPSPEKPTVIAPLGDRAIRFTRPHVASTRALVDAIKAWPGVEDVVVTRLDVAAYFVTPVAATNANADLARRIGKLSSLRTPIPMPREHELRAVYDGIDLEHCARETQLSTDEVIRLHADAIYEVDTIGFQPGFAYLVGLDPRLFVPRRPTPRERVPAGSLAIAGEYTAVYPFASSGGWNLIGRVDEAMFHPVNGARLALGDRVRFVR